MAQILHSFSKHEKNVKLDRIMSDEKAKLIYNDGKKRKRKMWKIKSSIMGWIPFWRSIVILYIPEFLQDFQNRYKIGEISHDKDIGNKNASSEIISP